MVRWHVLLEKNPQAKRGRCLICGQVKIRIAGYRKDGTEHWQCSKPREFRGVPSYYEALGYYKKDHCEMCGFVARVSFQLDVDHKDGNHNNNKLSNLQTLCANCHRLKTWADIKRGITYR